MSLGSLECDGLAHESDAAGGGLLASAHGDLPFRVGCHVVGEGDVDGVEVAVLDELLFAPQEEQLPLSVLLPPPLDLDGLLRRDRHAGDRAVEMLHHPRVHEGHRHPDHVGHLTVMATRMNRPRVGVRLGVLGDQKGVELPDHRDVGTLIPPRDLGLHAG